MKISSIEISNFKSYNETRVALGDLNILIGPNGAGKSNFISALRFLRDLTRSGLKNAVSLQGENYFRNIQLKGEAQVKINLTIEPRPGDEVNIAGSGGAPGVIPGSLFYSLVLETPENGPVSVKEDFLRQEFKLESDGKYESLFISLKNSGGKLSIDYSKSKEFEKRYGNILLGAKTATAGFIREDRLLISGNYFFLPFILDISSFIGDITIYDFNPYYLKQGSPLSGKAELEEDGSNIALVLKNILSKEDTRRAFFNLLNEAAPFLENIKVDKYMGRYLQAAFRESYTGSEYLPSFIMSEGTVFIIDIITALYFENKGLIVFEEPERRIHPYLMSKIVNMMEDASETKQILISTHNPEIVKHASPENVLLVSRDESGYSVITRPHEKKEIQAFLQNDLGLDDLFVQNMLDF